MEAGAEERIDHHITAFDGVGLDRLPARLAEHAGSDPAVAAVRALAADDGEAARVRVHTHRLVGDGAACPLHQVERGEREAGERLLGGLHLCRGAERLVPRPDHPSQRSRRTTQEAPAIVWEWVSETSISRMPTRSA